MKSELLTLGFAKNSWCHPVVEQYEKKISPLMPLEMRYLKISSYGRKNREEALRESDRTFLRAMEDKALQICFDERGKTLSSIEFSKSVSRALESGKQKIQWLVGGPFGLGPEVRDKCSLNVSLSSLVMNQQVATVVALEQIYRGLNIRAGLPYHNI